MNALLGSAAAEAFGQATPPHLETRQRSSRATTPDEKSAHTANSGSSLRAWDVHKEDF